MNKTISDIFCINFFKNDFLHPISSYFHKNMLSFIIFLSLFTNSIANLNFDIRWTEQKIIIQEVLTTNIEEYSVNKFVSEYHLQRDVSNFFTMYLVPLY